MRSILQSPPVKYVGWIALWLLVPAVFQYLTVYNMDALTLVRVYVWITDGLVGVLLIAALVWRYATNKVRSLANYDTVTGLPNRNLLHKRLDNAISHGVGHDQRHANGEIVALLFVDLDNFKNINDTYGHHVGDALLQQVASGMETCVRSTDTVSRTGGDEFVIVLPGLDCEESVVLSVKKIYKFLTKPIRIDDHELNVSASVGIALYPSDGTDKATLIQNADTAMYHAKRAGKGQYQFYNAATSRRTDVLYSAGHELRGAVERNELVLYYQPQVNVCTKRIIGVEALIRWQHPTKGLLLPSEFVPIAEQSHLIAAISNWAIREACTQAVTWHKQGINISMSINLSTSHVEEPGFAQVIDEIISSTGVNPNTLIFELTESVLANNPNVINTVFLPLRERGAQLSIDDFGTGYSSLNYLTTLPINSLKIDKSFIENINVNSDNIKIVKAVVMLAHSLGLTVMAEGVETNEQLEALRSVKCDEVQGYLFGQPMDAELMTSLLSSSNSARPKDHE